MDLLLFSVLVGWILVGIYSSILHYINTLRSKGGQNEL